MLSYYKRLFDSFRSVYPECYQEVINEFICLKMRYYQQNVGLGVIEILGILRNFKEDPLNQKAYADLYSDYGDSNFLCRIWMRSRSRGSASGICRDFWH